MTGLESEEEDDPKRILFFLIDLDRFGSSSDPSINGHLHYLLLVCLGDYIVNSCDFYSYRLIGKLTAFLQIQEFRLRNTTVDTSTSTARLVLSS